jgi:hypothetical protein
MADGKVVEIEAAGLRVLQGGRTGVTDRVSFHAGQPARIVVGSDEFATLRIEQAEVAPRQFDVIWDGSQLWLQDALRLGRTFVNGRTLNEWMPVVRQALVCIGSVRVWLTSRSSPTSDKTPDFAALERARQIEAHSSARVRLSDTCRITVPPELLARFNEQGVQ